MTTTAAGRRREDVPADFVDPFDDPPPTVADAPTTAAVPARADEDDVDDAFRGVEIRLIEEPPADAEPRADAAAPTGEVETKSPHLRLTDLGNAERFKAEHFSDLRYVEAWRTWLVYDKRLGVWRRSNAGARQRAHASARALYAGAVEHDDPDVRKAVSKWAHKSESNSAIESTVAVAATLAGFTIDAKELDANAGRVVVANGVVDLRTGALHPHRREEFATRRTSTAFRPEAKCPRFLRFLEEVFCGDADLVEFQRRAWGLALTGETREHVFIIHHGTGENGKSVLFAVARHVFAGYADSADFASFTVARSDGGRARPDLAKIVGARLVMAPEGADGARLDEGLLKSLHGGDEKAVRGLYESTFTYTPRYQLWLSSNHKPEIRGADRGIWRRVRFVPWNATFPVGRRDEGLGERLKLEESEGVLAWAIGGAATWYEEGLNTPAAIVAATEKYRAEQDVVGAFLAERCVVAADAEAGGGALYEAFTAWARANGETGGKSDAVSNRKFAALLNERGFSSTRTRKGARWRGLSLRDESDLFDGDEVAHA